MNDNNLECYICLDLISNDVNSNTYILECCKNLVHLDCLQKWYSNNKSNPNCFICNQYNQFCNDLIEPVTDNSYTLININNDLIEPDNDNSYTLNDINNVNTIQQTIHDTINNYFKKVGSILIVTIVVIIIFIVFF
jgi:hypothetical protein